MRYCLFLTYHKMVSLTGFCFFYGGSHDRVIQSSAGRDLHCRAVCHDGLAGSLTTVYVYAFQHRLAFLIVSCYIQPWKAGAGGVSPDSVRSERKQPQVNFSGSLSSLPL